MFTSIFPSLSALHTLQRVNLNDMDNSAYLVLKTVKDSSQRHLKICELLFVSDQIRVKDSTLRAFRFHEKSNKSDTPIAHHLSDAKSRSRKHR